MIDWRACREEVFLRCGTTTDRGHIRTWPSQRACDRV
jgi:hypothetical protein